MVTRVAHSQCPRCGYSLEGLPAAHVCPECGFEYDQATLCFRSRRFWRVAAGSLLMLLLGFYLLGPSLAAFVSVLFPVTPIAAYAVLLGVWALLSIAAIARARQHRRNYIVIGLKGMCIGSHRSLRTYTWDRINRIASTDISPWISLHGSDQSVPLPRVFDGRREAQLFRQAATTLQSLGPRAEENADQRQKAAAEIDALLAESDHRESPTGNVRRAPQLGIRGIGLGLMALSCVLIIVTSFANDRDAPKLITVSYLVGFWMGLVFFLIGQWRSDTKRKK